MAIAHPFPELLRRTAGPYQAAGQRSLRHVAVPKKRRRAERDPGGGQGEANARSALRVLALIAAVLLVLAGAPVMAAFGSESPASLAGTESPAYPVVTVKAGDTLWGLARRLAPDVNPVVAVRQLREVNALPDGLIRVGQRLRLPETFSRGRV